MMNETEIRKDLHLNGVGTAPGGTYRTIRVSGVGTVIGDVEADELVFSGTGAVKGNARVQKACLSGAGCIMGDLTAELLDVSGSGAIQGHVRATRVQISGSASLQHHVEADEMTASGVAHVNGNVRARLFRGSGCFTVRQNVAADEFRASGAFQVDGRVAAECVEIRPSGTCTIQTLIGKTIAVIDDLNQGSRNREQRRLTVEQIAAPEITLELTTAKTVRGRVVRIGPGCEIDTVEYGESLDVDPNATVRHTKYTGTGHAPHETE